MIVVAPRTSVDRGEGLARRLGAGFTLLEERVFPDGEVLLRASKPQDLKGEEEVILYFPLYPRQNEGLIGLLQALDLVGDYSPPTVEVTLIAPYLPYSRQDKRFLEGEPVTLRLLLKLLGTFNISRLITVDSHNPEACERLSPFPFLDLSATPLLVNYALEEIFHGRDPVLISPDKGGIGRVKEAAERSGLEYTYLEKERDRSTGEVVVSIPEPGAVEGRAVLILDDIISTGGTLIAAASILREGGATALVAGATHLLLLGGADHKILEAGYFQILGSDTIDTPYSKVSVEALIAEAVER
jgi:ribose-phosphate pyrophosphokinase